jgi:beta-glucosidase
VAFVTGMQGDDPKYFKTIATPKHYAVHSGPESERRRFNVEASPHDLEDTYLPAFRATIVEGKADSIMCAYNAVDGVPACASKFLLQTTLREAWKFQGYVTSDCGAVQFITTGHRFTPDNEHGSAAAVQAGTDTTCGEEYEALVQAVHDGLIKESEINTSLKRLFTARFRMGMFDPPDAVPFNQIPFSENDSPKHRELALKAAREAMVLLKNQEGILPLKSNYKSIAVIGPNAESLVALEGNYWGQPSHPVYPLDAILKLFEGKAKVLNASGPAGDEVAELYLEFPQVPGAPLRALRGFQRLHIAPGETRHVTYRLKPRDLSMVNDKGEHLVAPGEYNVFVGGGQPGETVAGVRARLEITGKIKLPR